MAGQFTVRPFNAFSRPEKSVKAKANITEKKIAKDIGGRRQPASGALPNRKGDVTTDEFLIDSKETDSKSIRVHADDLFKITKEANVARKHPALWLTVANQEWVCIPKDVFKEIIDGRNEKSID